MNFEFNENQNDFQGARLYANLYHCFGWGKRMSERRKYDEDYSADLPFRYGEYY